MKKTLSVILAVCFCCALALPAYASCEPYVLSESISPRWTNINYASCDADVIDGYLCVGAELSSHSVMDLKITIKISAEGLTTRTFTATGTDDYIDLYREIVAVEDTIYTVAFTYKAGTETHTETVRVYT